MSVSTNQICGFMWDLLQEWIRLEDSCGRLGRLLDELEAFSSTGEPEGEDEEEVVVQRRLDACQVNSVTLHTDVLSLCWLIFSLFSFLTTSLKLFLFLLTPSPQMYLHSCCFSKLIQPILYWSSLLLLGFLFAFWCCQILQFNKERHFEIKKLFEIYSICLLLISYISLHASQKPSESMTEQFFEFHQ